MKYSVYQIKLGNLEPSINELGGWGEAMAVHPEVKSYLEATSSNFNEVNFDHYQHVANIEATDLENLFHVGNVGPEEQIERLGPMHSLSVGDIVIDPSGKKFGVAHIGFEEVVI